MTGLVQFGTRAAVIAGTRDNAPYRVVEHAHG